jgi:hypothetical protein
MSRRSVGSASAKLVMSAATSNAQSVATPVVTSATATLMRKGEFMGVVSSGKTGAPGRENRRA